VLGHTVVYGLSHNPRRWWDNTSAAHIGFVPLDSSERFRPALEAAQPTLDVTDPVVRYQGGAFVAMGPFED
jgi:uronate dehydrogenase